MLVPPAADRLRIPLTNLDEELVRDTATEALSSYGTKAMRWVSASIFSAQVSACLLYTSYFEADRLLRDGELDASTEPLVQEVRALSADVLGLSIDAATGEMTGTAADLPLAKEDMDPTAMTEAKRQERMEQLVREICDKRGAGDVMSEKTDELYRLDKAMTLGDLSQLDAATVEELLTLYPDDEDVLLVAIKYYTRQESWAKARPLAQKLVSLNGS